MHDSMKKITITVATIAIFIIFFHAPVSGSNKTPKKGDTLLEIKMTVPQNDLERRYLGLERGETFIIPQIKATIVIVEIFSMYCPYCQKEAPEINRLYSIIQGNPNLKDKIKLIGIAAGNSSFEVGIYKKKYNVPFPLFPDEDFLIHKCIGEVRTPYFLGVKINADGTHKIFYSQLGKFNGAEPFLELIIKESGFNQEK